VKVNISDLDFEISFFEKLVKKKPDYVDALIPLAEAYTKKGWRAKGLAIDKRLAKLRKQDPIVHYNLACSYALLGKKDEALEALLKSIRFGYSDLNHLRRDPDLESLRSDPRFKEIFSPVKKSL
jgi:tetratricopeptide (TPR) repeat protein